MITGKIVTWTRSTGEIVVTSRVADALQGRSPAWCRGAQLHLLKEQVDGVWDLPELAGGWAA